MMKNCLRPGCKEDGSLLPPRYDGPACPKCGAKHEDRCPRCGYFAVAPIDGHPKLLRCPDCGDVFREAAGGKKELEAAPWAEIPQEVKDKVPKHLVGVRR